MQNRKYWLYIGLAVVILLALAGLDADTAWARPGGGQSYSGGSGSKSSGSGGGGGGDGGAIFYLIWELFNLTIRYPHIMLPIYGVIALFFIVDKLRKGKKPIVVNTHDAKREQAQREQQVRNYRKTDMNFSEPLFLDFAGALYHEFFRRAGTKSFAQLRPFVAPDILNVELKRNPPITYSDIVVGSAHIESINPSALGGMDQISVLFRTNINVHNPNGKITRYYTEEVWHFQRQAGVKSLEPAKLHTLACTNCAAPLDLTDEGKCRSCGHLTEPGKEQWVFAAATVRTRQVQGNPRSSLLTHVPEQGNDLPTLFSPRLQDGIQTLMYTEGNQQWPAYEKAFFEDVVRPCFMILYKSWTERKWEPVRPFLTDRLFESQKWWIEEYKRQKLVNKLDKIEILKIETARVDVDKFYAAITVRIFARCMDYTTDEQGKVLKGSPKQPRAFTEYWTFVKNASVPSGERPSATTKSCPSCGAPVKINESGKCEFCSAKVTDGSFNWVLTRIEQDDTYGY